MIELKIKIDDAEVMAAMRRLAASGSSMRPAMREIGEYLVDSTWRRFADYKGPDGTAWQANTEATMLAYLARRGGGTSRRPGEKGRNPYFLKNGRLNKRGANLLTGKKPLIGESKRLSSEIHYLAAADSVEVGSSLEYAAVQQFGAGRGDFGQTKRGAPIPWGDIPARPFLGLSAEDQGALLDILNEHLRRVIG